MVNYFKLINGRNFVGIASSLDFLKLQQKHRLLLLSDVEHGQYISVGGTLYRDQWMAPVTDDDIHYEVVSVIEIDEEEYNALYESMDSGDEVIVEPEIVETPEDEIPSDPNDEVTLEFIQEKKIATLSRQCQEAIVNGVDVELSSGEIKHYSLSVEDQLNIASMVTMLQQGVSAVPYHADGELCEYYSTEDMQRIATSATEWKTYHITYFNSLKNWVSSMDTVEDVASVTYGDEIPSEFCSVVLNQLMQAQEMS